MNYDAFAKKLVERARRKGADQAEVWLEVNRESSVKVRDGEVEELTQATSKGVGLRVLAGSRLGFTYTSEFDEKKVDELAERALAIAKVSAPDKNNGLPGKAELKKRQKTLDLFDPKVAELPADWLVHAAQGMERAAKAEDARIAAFESVGAGSTVSEVSFCSSEGVLDRASSTAIYLYAAPVASQGDQLQTGHWIDFKRFLDELEPAEQIGATAARRAARMLGARKVKTQRVPVVLDPFMAASFVGGLASAVNGDMVFKRASFLSEKLGERIAPEAVSVVDDGLKPRGLATSPFDGEGVPTRRTAVVEKGKLAAFLYDSYTARKAKAKTTANAARSYASLPHIGLNNFYLEAGPTPPEDILKGVDQGLFVTAMLGRGANPITGEYSRGANGLWIEKGELAYPVQEVTVAGNMLEMLGAIDAVGNDLQFRGGVAAPTLRFAELAVSGA